MATSRQDAEFSHVPSRTSRSSTESMSRDVEESFSLLADSDVSDFDVDDDQQLLRSGSRMTVEKDSGPRATPFSGGDEQRAKEATETEHRLTPREAIKAYPMAIFWSLMMSTCVIMEGYDTIL